jgi:hypothetical protein
LAYLDFNPENEYRYAMGMAASLMLGWTFLLVWADRKAVERKGVLILTVFPVISGLTLAGIFLVIVNLVPVGRMIPIWILQAGMISLFLFGYFNARGS